MQEQKKISVLFISRWYPYPGDPMLGLFVQRHAEAVSKYCKVNSLFAYPVDDQKSKFSILTNLHEEIEEILISYRRGKCLIHFLNPLINVIRHLKALNIGYKYLRKTQDKPDISHVNILTRTGIFALYLKLRFGIPYVITEHWSRYLSSNPSYTGFLRKLATKITVSNAAAVSTVSTILQKAMKNTGLSCKHWEIIPNVVSDDFFKAEILSKQNEIAQIVHISCFEDVSKNISGILRSIAMLKKKRNDFKLTLVGDGIDFENIKKLASELELDQNDIAFTGVLLKQDLIKQLQKSDFFVLFSNYETFAVVIPESLALGIPVIGSRAGAIPEVLPTNAGIVIDKGNENQLCEAMSKMIDTHHNYDSNQLRSLVKNKYSEEAVGKQFLRLYIEIIN
ncbi:MAG: glycosyltransferase [Bacteroidales bacterium]|nr:glycosyltransferase [Bacteroidales bacterium]